MKILSMNFTESHLLPHKVSTEGPALAVADINHDGLDDIFIGASKTFQNAVFLQTKDGKFVRKDEPRRWRKTVCGKMWMQNG